MPQLVNANEHLLPLYVLIKDAKLKITGMSRNVFSLFAIFAHYADIANEYVRER